MIKSKFSFWVVLVTFVIVVLTALHYLIFIKLSFLYNEALTPGAFIFVFLLLFTWVWLIFGELRTKVITVKIEGNLITAANFYGLGKKQTYDFSEFDGYRTALLPSKTGVYEYLYLLKDGKKKIKISQFYHRNYSPVKKLLAKKVKFIGRERFSYLRELKEIFE